MVSEITWRNLNRKKASGSDVTLLHFGESISQDKSLKSTEGLRTGGGEMLPPVLEKQDLLLNKIKIHSSVPQSPAGGAPRVSA